MSKNKITQMLVVLFVLILVPVLAQADQKKTTNPPPPPKPAPAARPAQPAARPVQRPAAQPARVQPGNTAVRPTGGAGTNTNIRPGAVNPNARPGVAGPNARPGVANPNVRPGGVNPNTRAGGVNPNLRPGGVTPTGGRARTPTPTRTVATRGGGSLEVDRNNKPTHFVGKQGQEARFGAKGQIREVRDPKRNIVIQHGLRPGDRRIVTERNGRRLVAMGPHRGYMERPYYRDRYGRAYVQRTYWVHGHPYAYAYRDHFYHGVHYYHYVPGYYYHPVFYGWAYNPWAAPVYYDWGWGPAPWFYGGYFAPAPYYPSASLWLTDFLLAENLKLAYEAKQDAAASPEAYQSGEQPQPQEGGSPAATQLSPEVKQMIEAEVHRQLEAEQAAAQSPQAQPANDQVPPPALDPAQRLFVVSSNLGVSTTEGQECELTPGDVITRIDDTPGDDSKVKVSVMSSKPGDCSVGSSPRVEVSDLQEMHNSFREQLDSGLKTLADKSGTGGLPKAPDTQTSAGEVAPPAPDRNIDAQLADQQKEATQAEAEVRQEVQTGQPPSNQ